MPKARKPSKAALNRLARLPRLPDLVLEGGKRPLGIYMREGGETIQPQVALWVDAGSSFIRATEIINPLESADEGVAEALNALLAAVGGPFLPMFPLPALPDEEAPEGQGAGNGPGIQLRQPQPPQAGLPAAIRVNDAALAEAARAVFAPLDVPVEHTDELPAFDEAFRSLSDAMGADEAAGPPAPFAWEIDPALLPPLFKAAATYGRRAPWNDFLDHPPFAVGLGEHGPEPDVGTLYACVMGAAGMVEGVAFYYSLDDFRRAVTRGEAISEDDEALDEAVEMLRRAGAPIDQVPPEMLRDVVTSLGIDLGDGAAGDDESGQENALVLFFTEEEETDPTYVEWLGERGLTYPASVGVPSFLRTAPGAEPRDPDAREVAALTLALGALNGFLSRHGRSLAGPFPPPEELVDTIRVDGPAGKLPIEVRYPPAEYLADAAFAALDALTEADERDDVDEPARPPSPAGPTTLYRFQVKLDWKKSVWRRIELRGDQTLHDLHNAIQSAFEWDDDHLYAFFLSGRAWDSASEYGSPYGEGRSAAGYRLEHLPLQAGQQFLYIFDFGDELRHQVKLEAIAPGGVQPGVAYPRVTESRGAAVPQY